MTSEASTGFLDDCLTFLEKFISVNSFNFTDFCNIWNDMNFHCIFYGRQNAEELNFFVEEALTIVKRTLIRSNELIEKCGCLYLLYTIYDKQPDKGVAKIRVTQNDWQSLKNFYEALNGENHQHPFLIWWKLILDDAYHFCYFESKYILEGSGKNSAGKLQDSDPDSLFKPISNIVSQELENLQSTHGILTALGALEIAYNEMKESLDIGEKETDNRSMPNTEIVKEINEAIDEMQENFQHVSKLREMRKKKKILKTAQGIEDKSDEEESRSIKDKRKSIRDKAIKVEKKKISVTDEERPSSSVDHTGLQNYVKTSKRRLVDPKHFKKITEVQKIFEMNSLLDNALHSQITPIKTMETRRNDSSSDDVPLSEVKREKRKLSEL